MIDYEFGYWGIGFVLTTKGGDLFKRSTALALVPASFALCLSLFAPKIIGLLGDDIEASIDWENRVDRFKPMTAIWSSFTFALSFLLVFRTQVAYSRYWDGIGLLESVRAVWFNAASNLFAFCNQDPERSKAVLIFQHLVVKLMSILYCTALQEVSVMENDSFNALGDFGLDQESMCFLSVVPDRPEVVMQWIQRLVMESNEDGVLKVSPPILSRVFQELSNGVVNVSDARKITDFPFPFPFAQMLTFLLLTFTMVQPWVSVLVVDSAVISALLTFACVCVMWSINYIAAEIEMPFGDDPNDLPIRALQETFNRKLTVLLHPMTQNPPSFDMGQHLHPDEDHGAVLSHVSSDCVHGGLPEALSHNPLEGLNTVMDNALSSHAKSGRTSVRDGDRKSKVKRERNWLESNVRNWAAKFGHPTETPQQRRVTARMVIHHMNEAGSAEDDNVDLARNGSNDAHGGNGLALTSSGLSPRLMTIEEKPVVKMTAASSYLTRHDEKQEKLQRFGVDEPPSHTTEEGSLSDGLGPVGPPSTWRSQPKIASPSKTGPSEATILGNNASPGVGSGGFPSREDSERTLVAYALPASNPLQSLHIEHQADRCSTDAVS